MNALLANLHFREARQQVRIAVGERVRRELLDRLRNDLRATTPTMADYTLEELRKHLQSVMRLNAGYEREEVLVALARHLGFSRITDSTREAIKSAFNSAIRQGILRYEGTRIWREKD